MGVPAAKPHKSYLAPMQRVPLQCLAPSVLPALGGAPGDVGEGGGTVGRQVLVHLPGLAEVGGALDQHCSRQWRLQSKERGTYVTWHTPAGSHSGDACPPPPASLRSPQAAGATPYPAGYQKLLCLPCSLGPAPLQPRTRSHQVRVCTKEIFWQTVVGWEPITLLCSSQIPRGMAMQTGKMEGWGHNPWHASYREGREPCAEIPTSSEAHPPSCVTSSRAGMMHTNPEVKQDAAELECLVQIQLQRDALDACGQRGSFRGADSGLQENKPLSFLSQAIYFLLSFQSIEFNTSSSSPQCRLLPGVRSRGLARDPNMPKGTHHSGTATSVSAQRKTGRSPHGGHCRHVGAASHTCSISHSTGRERAGGSDRPGSAGGKDLAADPRGEVSKCSMDSPRNKWHQ